jgi:hypothetical protein
MSNCLGFGGKVYKPLPYTSIGVREVAEKPLKNRLKNMDVQAAANSSACSNEGGLSAEEKELKWFEDMVYLSNKYCPHCGQEFKINDKVLELSCGDFIITVHSKCHARALCFGDC